MSGSCQPAVSRLDASALMDSSLDLIHETSCHGWLTESCIVLFVDQVL